MKTILHKAHDRGYFDHGWLKTSHSFSFGHYYDPEKMHFGRLRVLNDDVVAPRRGFGTHPHDNMEIVSIPLSGALAHKDSAGHEQVIYPNDVQVMSAGTGLFHSEYNHSETDEAAFLQVWVMPDERGHSARYDQKTFDPAERENQFQVLVSPDQNGLWLHQNVWFSRVALAAGRTLTYALHGDQNGVYVFLLDGEITIAETQLLRRDAMGIWDVSDVSLFAAQDSDVLVIEIPMD